MKLTVVGTGHVGLVSGACFANMIGCCATPADASEWVLAA